MKTQMAFMLSSPQVRLYQEQVIEPQIRELRNKLSIAEKALEFYATPEVYFCEGIFEKPETWKQNEEMNPYVENMMDDDSGERAHKALAVIRGEIK